MHWFFAKMSTNKSEIVEVNGYGYIATNDKGENDLTYFD